MTTEQLTEKESAAQAQVEQALLIRMKVAREAFFDRLAADGIVPRDEPQAERMIQLGQFAVNKQAEEAGDSADELDAIYSKVASHGFFDAPEAEAANFELINDAVTKTASYAADPDVTASMLHLLAATGQ